MTIVNHQLGSRLRRYELSEVAVSPPLILTNLYLLPKIHSDEGYVRAIALQCDRISEMQQLFSNVRFFCQSLFWRW